MFILNVLIGIGDIQNFIFGGIARSISRIKIAECKLDKKHKNNIIVCLYNITTSQRRNTIKPIYLYTIKCMLCIEVQDEYLKLN
jgi:hypothetical protein